MLAIVFVALALRLARLTFQPLWADEGYSVYFASLDVAALAAATAADIHPPLYYYVLKLWMALLGSGECALRLLSVLFGVATVALVYALARRLGGPRVAPGAALLLAVSPFHIYYSQEVRMYALAGLLAVASTLCMVRVLDAWGVPSRSHGRARAWLPYALLYVGVSAAALYTLYYAAFIMLAQTAFVLFAYRRQRAILLTWLLIEAATLAAYAPWVVGASGALTSYVAGKVTVERYTPLDPVTFLWHVAAALGMGVPSAGRAFLTLGALPVVGLAIAALAPARSSAHATDQADGYSGDDAWTLHAAPLLACLVVVPLVAGYVVNLLWPFSPAGFQRLFLYCLPFFLILVAQGLLRLLPLLAARVARHGALSSPRVALGVLVTAATVVCLGGTLADFYLSPRYGQDDYRPLVRRMAAVAHPDDVLVAFYPWQVGFVRSYYVGALPELRFVDNAAAWAGDPALMRQELGELGRQHGRLWFVSYEAAGRLLESAVTGHLDGAAFSAIAEWFGNHRLLLYSFGGVVPLQKGTVAASGGMALDAASVSLDPLEAGRDCVRVALGWSNAGMFGTSRQVALRLVDSADRTWAQRDSPPFNGAALDSLALDRSAVADNHALVVPVTTPPGSYRLLLGIYDTAARRNVSLSSATGQPLGSEIELATVVVTKSTYRPPLEALGLAQHTSVRFAGGPQLVGFAAPAQARPGQTVQLDLYWQAEQKVADDLTLFVQLRDQRDKVWGLYEGVATASYAVTRWTAGELLRSQIAFLLAPDAPSGNYQLVVGWLKGRSKQRLLLERGGNEVAVATVKVTAREHTMTLPQPAKAMDERVGDDIQFLGLDGPAGDIRRGAAMELTLYWRALRRMEIGYTMFVHLVDEHGRIWAQDDHEPMNGEAPTTSWLPGEVIVDRYVLDVPADLPAGAYRLLAGVYQHNGARLPVRSAAGEAGRDVIQLAGVRF